MALPTVNILDVFRRVIFWSKWSILNPVIGFAALTIAFTRFFNYCLQLLYQQIPSIPIFDGFSNVDVEWKSFLMYVCAGDHWLTLFRFVFNVFNLVVSSVPGVIVAWWTARLIFGKLSFVRTAFDYIMKRGV